MNLVLTPAAARGSSGTLRPLHPVSTMGVDLATRSFSSIGKTENYYTADRSDFLNWVGGRYERVLDIGCASGQNGDWLRQHGAVHLVGVEIDDESAGRAAANYDVVHNEPIEVALNRLDGPYDLVICADVLEHLVDPWSVVERLHRVAAPQGAIAVSIPNIRYFRALLRIGFGRGFVYEPSGLFDVTHLRWFTRRDVFRLLSGRGWRVRRWKGRKLGRRAEQLSRVSAGRLDEWLTYQWYVVAIKDG